MTASEYLKQYPYIPFTKDIDEMELFDIPKIVRVYKYPKDSGKNQKDAGNSGNMPCVSTKESEVQENAKAKKTAKKERKAAIAYTDGSYNPKTKKCGAGIVYTDDKGVEIVMSIPLKVDEETAKMMNIVGEVQAALTAVETALADGMDEIVICYDYLGVQTWVTGEWKAKKDFTKDYKEKMLSCMNRIAIRFKKVAAHTGVKENEKADKAAKAAVGL